MNGTVKLTRKGVELGGKYEVLLCGSLFYFRLHRSVWKDRIEKLKRAGYNCVDVYFPWNYHEKEDGTFDFTGERDIGYFLDELSKAGIYVIARPGPYICSEWNGGGIPARILESGKPIRCDSEYFIAETKKWYDAVLREIAPYTYPKGGSVILLQIENELDFFDCPNPEAYVAKLTEIAKKTIKDIPHFCCAGQYDVFRAGGLVEGVEATLNCYPDSLDSSFDSELHGYGLRFMDRNKPLMVSETNRDHFLLRRELSCGAKLLGAYNQVAGVNTEYYQAVNNWGKPDAMLATLYDFWSMVDVIGNFRPEAEEAVLMSAFLRAVGEPIAKALPSKNVIVPDACSFVTTDLGFRILELDGGGVAVCVPNFSEKPGEVSFYYKSYTLSATVGVAKAPFMLFDFPLKDKGVNAILTRANCEPIAIDEKGLVFYLDSGSPMVGLDFGDGEVIVKEDKNIGGIRVRFLKRESALGFLCSGNLPKTEREYIERVDEVYAVEKPEFREIGGGERGLNFGALNVSEGEVEYSLVIPAGSKLFIEHPCDTVKVTVDNKPGETYYASGRDVFAPPSVGGKYEVTVEKWGHSNFDDSQSPATRISCKKGAIAFGYVSIEQKLGRMDFRLLDTYGAKKIDLGGEIPVRIGVEKWNSSRKPVICSYSASVTNTAKRLILKVTEKTDVAVYIDGKLVGECDFGTFELTKYIGEGETKTLTLVYRKHLWTDDVGSVTLYHIFPEKPRAIRALTKTEMLKMHGKGELVELPLKVEERTAVMLPVECKRECLLKFEGKNIMVTMVMDGKVQGRAIVDWDHAPALHGGDPDKLYYCPAMGNDAYLYIKPLGKDASLDEIKLIYN